jgi:type IV pilus assembly protein PilC
LSTSKRKPKLPSKELLEWVRIVRTLLHSNIELYQALHFCQHSITKKKSLMLITFISNQLNEGSSLSIALKNSPFTLPEIFIGMMSIGEKSGSLSKTLAVLEQYLVNTQRMKEKLVSSLIYPAMVLSVMLLGSFFIALFIIPSLAEATKSLHIQQEESLGNSLQYLQGVQFSLILMLVIGVGLAVAHHIMLQKSPQYLYIYDQIKIQGWVFRSFFGRLFFWHFSFYMQSLLASGMRFEQALVEVMHFLPNTFLQKEIQQIHASLLKGMRAQECFKESAFPKEFTLWLSVSAETGDSLATFSLLQKYYEDRLQQYIDRMTSLIDPILIVLIGVILLIFILQFIVPFFNELTNLVTFF